MTRSRNQKNRDRQRRQRQAISNELNYYKTNTFAEEEQEQIAQKIRLLERDLRQNGVPNTYK